MELQNKCLRWFLTAGLLIFFPLVILIVAIFAGFAIPIEVTRSFIYRQYTAAKFVLCQDFGKVKHSNKCIKLLSAPMIALVKIPMFALLLAWLLFIFALDVAFGMVCFAVIFGLFGTLGWPLMIFVALKALYNWSGDHFY